MDLDALLGGGSFLASGAAGDLSAAAGGTDAGFAAWSVLPPMHLTTSAAWPSELGLPDGAADDFGCGGGGGGAGGAGAPTHAHGAAAPSLGAAAPRPLDAAVVSWRCLDRSHAADCIACQPPPPFESAAGWMLVGDKPKSGEKRLRAQLAKTPEWGASEQRLAAAEHAARVALPPLAAALRSKNIADVRKAHFFVLCDFWRYRSDLWRLSGAAGKRGRLLEAAAAAAAAAAPAPQLLLGGAVETLRARLMAATAVYAAATREEAAFAAMLAEPEAPTPSFSIAMFDMVLPSSRGLLAYLGRYRRELAAAAAGMDADARRGPWWLCAPAAAALTRVEAHLTFTQTLLAAAGAGYAMMTAEGANLCAPERAVAALFGGGVRELCAITAVTQSAMANARLGMDTGEYMAVAALVLATHEAHLQHEILLVERRRSWCLAHRRGLLPQAHKRGPGHFWDSFFRATNEMAVPLARGCMPDLASTMEASARSAAGRMQDALAAA